MGNGAFPFGYSLAGYAHLVGQFFLAPTHFFTEGNDFVSEDHNVFFSFCDVGGAFVPQGKGTTFCGCRATKQALQCVNRRLQLLFTMKKRRIFRRKAAQEAF